MSDLDELIAAVEAGKCWLPDSEKWVSVSLNGCRVTDAFHGDLNAALRLHDALLPGWKWGAGFGVTKGFAAVCPKGESPTRALSVEHATPARAWLLAILRALQAKATPDA